MELKKTEGGSIFRKIALGSWNTVGDPSVYGLLEIEMSEALKYLEKINQNSTFKIGVSELVAKATALVLKDRPEMNGLLRWGRIYLRKNIDLFFQVNVPGEGDDPTGKANLLGVVIRKADQKKLLEIAEELKTKSQRLKSGEDNEISKASKVFKFIPWLFAKWALNINSFLTYDLLFPVKYFGLPEDPFGSLMITNVGTLGIDTAWAPLVPYTRCPLLLTVGAVQVRPWVVENQVVAKPVLRIGCTFDHRFMDGTHAAAMLKKFKAIFQNPENFDL